MFVLLQISSVKIDLHGIIQLSSMIFPLSITNGNIYYQATRVICEKLQFIMAFYVQLTM